MPSPPHGRHAAGDEGEAANLERSAGSLSAPDEWVPSPPGKHTFENFTIEAHPKTAGKKNTRYLLG